MSTTPAMPGIGDVAPDFSGPDQHGRTVRLSDFRGRPVCLYFYPKDDTPGCTKQACSLRDADAALAEAGIQVIGVSPDGVASHERFAEKYALGFPLVADPEREIMARYGVYGEKSLYGKFVVGVKRTTFLLDEDGVVLHVFKRPDTKAHAEEVLAKYRALQG